MVELEEVGRWHRKMVDTIDKVVVDMHELLKRLLHFQASSLQVVQFCEQYRKVKKAFQENEERIEFCVRDCESYEQMEASYQNCKESFEAAENISISLKDCALTWLGRVVDVESGLQNVLNIFLPFQDEEVLAESSKVMKEFKERQGLLNDALSACLRHAEGTAPLASSSKKTEAVAANPPQSQKTMHTYIRKSPPLIQTLLSADNQISATNLNDANETEPIHLIAASNPSQSSNPNQKTFSRVKSPVLVKVDYERLYSVDNQISSANLNDTNETSPIRSGEASASSSDSEEQKLAQARFVKSPSQSQASSSRKPHAEIATIIDARTSYSNSDIQSNAVDRGYSLEKEMNRVKNETSNDYFMEEQDSNQSIPQVIRSSAKNEKRKREIVLNHASDSDSPRIWPIYNGDKEGKRLRTSSEGMADALATSNRDRYSTVESVSKGTTSIKTLSSRASNGDDSPYEEQEDDHFSDSDYIGDEASKNKRSKRTTKKGVHPPSLEKKVGKQKDKQQDSKEKSQVEDKERRPRAIESKVIVDLT